MKFTLKLLSLVLVTSASTVAFADDAPALPFGLEFSGSAAMTTDYRFRGMSQNENDPAVQAGFHLASKSGLYAGVWGSNVKLANGDTETANLELDPYIGYTYTFEDVAFTPWVDVGIWYYGYPSNSDLAFAEYYVKAGVSGLIASNDGLNVTANYTNKFWGGKDNAWYFSMGYAVPFGETGFGANANVGYTTVSNNTDEKYFNGKDHYTDWKVGVTYDFKSISGFTAELAAVGTDISKNGLDKATKRLNDTGAVFTLTKSF